MWRQMEKHFQTPALKNATVRDHRLVYKAIESHDPRGARAAMHRHLQRVAREFESFELFKQREQKGGGSRKAAP
jgi:GntR family uxuAB operon transcriptional repressor